MIDLPAAGTRTRWPYWLGALSIAICCAEVAYRLASGPEQYSQFTVGSIAWRSASKGQDYVLLGALLMGFACAWLVLLVLDRLVEKRLGAEDVLETRSLIAYVTLPSVVWATGLVLGSASSPDPVRLSSVGVVLAIALSFLATRRPFKDSHSTKPGRAAGIVLLATAFGALSALVGAFAINRWAAILDHTFLWTGEPSALWLAASGAACGLALGLWGWWRERSNPSPLFSVLLAAQLVLPWAFLLVVPTPWILGSVVTFGVPTKRIICVALVLVAIGYLDLFRRLRSRRVDAAGPNPLHALSPVAIAGALLFVKLGPTYVGALDPDDYHFGEMLLPWWSLVTDSSVPFWDHVPARGLINYLGGAAAAVVFDGTAAGILATAPLVSGLTLLLGLVSLSPLIGVLPAAGAFLLMPIWHSLNQIDIVNTAALAGLCVAYLRLRPVVWLPLWLCAGVFAFLWAPAQGSALVLATTPLGIWQVFRAYQAQRRELAKLTGWLVLAGAILLVVTPLGRTIAGAVRYGLENSEVGSAAHAVDWRLGLTAPTPLNHWLWEAVRTSWIAVGLAGIAALLSVWVEGVRARREALLVVGVPIVLLTILFIYRAAGRIDPGSVSRLGYTSIWMATLLLPLLLHASWGPGHWPAILTLTMAAGGLLVPALGPLDLRSVARHAYQAVPAPADIGRARLFGLPNVGSAWLPAETLARLGAIRRALDVLLNPDETYLDLTNRNAQYFYLGLRLPIESGALYNLPNDSQQLRAIERLSAEPVPVVLAWAEPQLWDGGPQSYRAYAIYRYLIWRYVPVRIDGAIFLVAPDRLRRLTDQPGLHVDAADPAVLLDTVFRSSDIQALPVSWGSSWSTLESRVSSVRRVESSEPINVTDVVRSGRNQYRTVGAAPSVEWALSSPPLAGKEAGVLTFDFECPARLGGVGLEVAWAVSGKEPAQEARVRFLSASRLAVPLDAAPRWLLAQSIGRFQIRLTQPDLCPNFSISNIELWQRRITGMTDPQ